MPMSCYCKYISKTERGTKTSPLLSPSSNKESESEMTDATNTQTDAPEIDAETGEPKAKRTYKPREVPTEADAAELLARFSNKPTTATRSKADIEREKLTTKFDAAVTKLVQDNADVFGASDDAPAQVAALRALDGIKGKFAKVVASIPDAHYGE